jgi:hypothetical protein
MTREDAISLAGSIFISYRRDDTGESAGRIYDWLLREFPQKAVFKDVDSIPLGVDFREHLKDALTRCRIVLVLIGSKWSSICDKQGNRRLENPADLVRIEAETALSRADLRVIPVLVGGASLPPGDELPGRLGELRFLNAAEVRRDPDFANDMARLIKHMKLALQPEPPAETSRHGEADSVKAEFSPPTKGVTLRANNEPTSGGDVEPVKVPTTGIVLGDDSLPPELPRIELRFHRHCIAGMRGVFQLRVRNADWRPFCGAKLKLVSSSWKDHEVEIDLFPLLANEEAFDTFVAVFSDAGPGTIQSCILQYPGPWGMLTAQGRWPGEFPVLSYEAAMRDASRGVEGGSNSETDRLNDYLLKDLPASFVQIRFSPPQIALEELLPSIRDTLLGTDLKKVEISRGEAVWFSQYPVRQKDWERLMTGSLALQRARANRESADGEQSNCPMHYVDMEEAKAFCQVLNEEAAATGLARPGYHYRLPTVMEWRIACGFEVLTDSELNAEAWHGGRDLNACQPVGRLSPNKHGLYDMRGNVFEWCLPDKAGSSDAFIAGGSWFNHHADRLACRNGQPGPCAPKTRSSRIGFRVVLARQGTGPHR